MCVCEGVYWEGKEFAVLNQNQEEVTGHAI